MHLKLVRTNASLVKGLVVVGVTCSVDAFTAMRMLTLVLQIEDDGYA